MVQVCCPAVVKPYILLTLIQIISMRSAAEDNRRGREMSSYYELDKQ